MISFGRHWCKADSVFAGAAQVLWQQMRDPFRPFPREGEVCMREVLQGNFFRIEGKRRWAGKQQQVPMLDRSGISLQWVNNILVFGTILFTFAFRAVRPYPDLIKVVHDLRNQLRLRCYKSCFEITLMIAFRPHSSTS